MPSDKKILPKCLITYDKKHINDDTIYRANKPQRRSTCFGFYYLFPLLPAAMVTSFIPLQNITRRRTNSVL